MAEFNKVVIFGVGLIGGSFALGLRAAGAVEEVVGFGRSPKSLQQALDLGVIDRAGINPRPKRVIPIWGGGATEAAYKRAARLADGFIFSGAAHETALRGWKKIREFLTDEGRSVAGFGAEYLVPPGVKPAAALDLIKLWRDLGGTHAAVSTLGHGFTTTAQHADYLAQVRALLK